MRWSCRKPSGTFLRSRPASCLSRLRSYCKLSLSLLSGHPWTLMCICWHSSWSFWRSSGAFLLLPGAFSSALHPWCCPPLFSCLRPVFRIFLQLYPHSRQSCYPAWKPGVPDACQARWWWIPWSQTPHRNNRPLPHPLHRLPWQLPRTSSSWFFSASGLRLQCPWSHLRRCVYRSRPWKPWTVNGSQVYPLRFPVMSPP